MKTFKLFRKKDISGVSGTGEVAEGVVFDKGTAVLSWFGDVHSIVIYRSIVELEHVHGHDGNTEVVYSKKK